jgi:hypothetical protein
MTKYNDYLYLIIQAEYINPEINVNEIIADALYDIISNGTITLNEQLYNFSVERKTNIPIPKHLLKASRDFIKTHFSSLIYNIKELEIFFDMASSSLSIKSDITVFYTSDALFRQKLKEFQKSDKYLKEPAVVMHKGTIYTIDQHFQINNSTGKAYSRKNKLLRYNNSYQKTLIDKYPFDKRIEFLLTNRNTGYRLNIKNLDCNSMEILNKFSEYLSIYFTKYFLSIFDFKNIEHLPHFKKIYFNAAYLQKRKYTGNSLIIRKGKYIKKNDRYIILHKFNYILREEYKRIKSEYLQDIAILKNFFKYKYALSIEYHTQYGIYNLDTYEGYKGISFDEEYVPFGLYYLTPIGYIKI